MLLKEDVKQIAQKGISEEQIETQLKQFKTGFPFLKLEAAASIGHGILSMGDADRKQYIDIWNNYKAAGHKIVKFVPASGAASRMFKNLYAFLGADYVVPQTDFENLFFVHLSDFAFFDALDAACKKVFRTSASVLRQQGRFKDIVWV